MLTQGTLQIIISTDGWASFATFLFNDGHGIRALAETELLQFEAGDQIRRSVSQNNRNFNLQTLREALSSFRIDGM